MLSGARSGITVTALLAGYVAEPLLGEGSAALLGLSGSDPGEVRDVPADCGASIPPAAEASVLLSCAHVARMFAEDRAAAR